LELDPGVLIAARYRVERRAGEEAAAGALAADDLAGPVPARDTRVDEPVLLHVAPAAVADSWRPRFRRAVRFGRRLDPAGFGRALDWGDLEDGGCFLVSEPGAGALPFEPAAGPRPERLRGVLDAARLVERAHERGVVHGDLVPERVLRTAEGEVALAGAGLARRDDEARAVEDVAALGRLLYLALTGERPPAGPAHPRQVDPSVSTALDALCAEALGDRPWAPERTAAWFRRTLEEATGERATRPDDEPRDDGPDAAAGAPERGPPTAVEGAVEPAPADRRPEPRRRRRRRGPVAAAILALGAGAAAAVALDLGGVRARLAALGPAPAGPVELVELTPGEGDVVRAGPIAVRGRIAPASPGEVFVGPRSGRIAADGAFVVEDVPLDEGPRTLAVEVRPERGRLLRREVRLRADATAPEVELLEPADGAAVSEGAVRLRGVTRDRSPVEVRVDGRLVARGPGRVVADVPLEPGADAVEVVVRDAAGNETTVVRAIEQVAAGEVERRAAAAALAAGELERARAAARRALAVDPDLGPARAVLAEVRFWSDPGARAEALALAEEAAAAAPDDAYALALRGFLRLERTPSLKVGRRSAGLDRALADAQAAYGIDPEEPLAYVVMAEVHGARRASRRAEGNASRACELPGRRPFAYLLRGRLRLLDLDVLAARADFERVLDLTAAGGWGGLRALALTHLAGLLVQHDEFEAARRRLDEALALDPRIPEAYYHRGVWHHSDKDQGRDYGQAVADLSRALELWPEFADAFYYRAAAHFDLGQYRRSLADLAEAERLAAAGEGFFPRHNVTYIRANAYLRLERWEDAVAEFERFLEAAPAGESSVFYAQERLRTALEHLRANEPEAAPADDGPAVVRLTLYPPRARPGEVVVVRAEVALDPGWSVLAADAPAGEGARLDLPPLPAVGRVVAPSAVEVDLPDLGPARVHRAPVLFARQFRVPPRSSGRLHLRVALTYTAVREAAGVVAPAEAVAVLPLEVLAPEEDAPDAAPPSAEDPPGAETPPSAEEAPGPR